MATSARSKSNTSGCCAIRSPTKKPADGVPMLRVRSSLPGLVAPLVLCFSASAASAQETVRIGAGFGLAFLPAYICEDLKLVEKRGKEAHVEPKASYQRFFGAGPLQEAIGTGAIDIAPLLAAWEK